VSTLQILPILLVDRDGDHADALRSANGADLQGEQSTRVIVRVFLAFALLLVALFLASCSSLAALGEGARTARDVARGACALLDAAEGGSPAEVTAALAGALRTITEQQATAAEARGDREAVRALLRSAEASMLAARAAAEEIAKLAGGAPVACPASSTVAP
jgi:biopolymer transport protein ExbB/TolQ